MIRLNHLALVVGNYGRSRDWYTRNLGLKVEFEIAERNTVALQDDSGFTDKPDILAQTLGPRRDP
jgi:catechol 2,3-dioxygenase-like lactoylglutathione lyase family enzyme